MAAWVKDLSRNGPTWNPDNKPYDHYNRTLPIANLPTEIPEYAGERVLFFDAASGIGTMYQAGSNVTDNWLLVSVNSIRG